MQEVWVGTRGLAWLVWRAVEKMKVFFSFLSCCIHPAQHTGHLFISCNEAGCLKQKHKKRIWEFVLSVYVYDKDLIVFFKVEKETACQMKRNSLCFEGKMLLWNKYEKRPDNWFLVQSNYNDYFLAKVILKWLSELCWNWDLAWAGWLRTHTKYI